jgi:4-diphosphocytidyl-2-C-methyl-D-erythritol kinase
MHELAKINEILKVLHKREDGYHELRTIFQTISLADSLTVEYTPSRKTSIELVSELDIPPEENLVVRAARAVLDEMRKTGQLRFILEKRIPAGGGLGGGSSDAAAVLLGLPVLAGVDLPLETLVRLGAGLGSDVPFFLLGGTALGAGRGEELHPLPDAPMLRGLLVCPGINLSTQEAYGALGRGLTPASDSCNMSIFRTLSWSLGSGVFAEAWPACGENDFEPFAFERYPLLAEICRALERCGAKPAMMSGSGSSLFGIFENKDDVERARKALRDLQTESFYLVSRGRYHGMWWRRLMGHLRCKEWPPRSRYAR